MIETEPTKKDFERAKRMEEIRKRAELQKAKNELINTANDKMTDATRQIRNDLVGLNNEVTELADVCKDKLMNVKQGIQKANHYMDIIEAGCTVAENIVNLHPVAHVVVKGIKWLVRLGRKITRVVEKVVDKGLGLTAGVNTINNKMIEAPDRVQNTIIEIAQDAFDVIDI